MHRVVLADHHKTAREALEGLTFPGLDITFDMGKSGAGVGALPPGRAVALAPGLRPGPRFMALGVARISRGLGVADHRPS